MTRRNRSNPNRFFFKFCFKYINHWLNKKWELEVPSNSKGLDTSNFFKKSLIDIITIGFFYYYVFYYLSFYCYMLCCKSQQKEEIEYMCIQ